MTGQQRPIGFWLKLVDSLIDAQFADTLEEHGVTRRQWQLLNVLSRGHASADQLNNAVAPFIAADDEDTILDHLTELIDSEWVVERTDVYVLTDRGRGALERMTLVVTDQRSALTDGITEDQYVSTLSTLERMARNMGWSDEQPGH